MHTIYTRQFSFNNWIDIVKKNDTNSANDKVVYFCEYDYDIVVFHMDLIYLQPSEENLL
jgi:hypothetical protein